MVSKSSGTATPDRTPRPGATLRVSAVMRTADASGLLKDKSKRISGRVSPALLEAAKQRTGIKSTAELNEYGLANLALEDGFAETFRAARGTIDPRLRLGFERE